MSDRIAIMHEGRLEQVGDAREIYEEPQSAFVATFIGETNLFEGVVEAVDGDVVHLRFESGCVAGMGAGFDPGDLASLSIRPERMRFSSEPSACACLRAQVRDQVYIGSAQKCIAVLPNGQEVRMERLSSESVPESGAVYLSWDPRDARVVRSAGQTVYTALENAPFA